MNISIYVLKLEEDKFYVGQAKNIKSRFTQHLKGKLSSDWTKKYKPIKIIEVIETEFTEVSQAIGKENEVTVEYMRKYGWKNVRGGDYCSLNEERLRFLLSANTNLGNELLPIKNATDYDSSIDSYVFFVLELEENNYFVGKTTNLKLAVLNEYNGLGSEWTKLYKPIKIISVIDVIDDNETIIRKKHNDLVISYMKSKGFNKVRGGDFYKSDHRNHKNKVLNYTDIFGKKS
ncbi:GIY-YIG nuclease family protein [Capnocytophaga cynodegmi]|uniref:GIY-YIG nuclease family protein n=1 Tax=Capnocytophaga cynodegmi TaxID=28189 RepID=UPI0037CD5025